MNSIRRLTRRTARSLVLAVALAGTMIVPAAAYAQANPPAQNAPTGPPGRRPVNGEPVVLAFNNRTIPETLDFIVEATGKMLIVKSTVNNFRFTLINDEPLPRDEAVNRLFQAFLQVDVAVIETEDTITLDMATEAPRYDLPVIPAEESTLNRRDVGNFVNKVYKLRFATAANLDAVFSEQLPTWAKLDVDEGSNQLVLMGSIGLAQRLEKLVNALDRPSEASTRTFILKHADASEVAAWIEAMFPQDGGATSGRNVQQQRGRGPVQPNVPGGNVNSSIPAATVPLRVTSDARTNSVTVKGDPVAVEQIEQLILNQWDKPLTSDKDIIRIYTLQYRDVIVVRDILQELIAGQSSGGAGGGAAARVAAAQGGASGSTGPDQRLANQFRFQADASANQLLVIGRTAAAFEYLDDIIQRLDQPGSSDLPIVIELKHADAGEIAQQINVLLAERGVQSDFTGREEGLTEFSVQDSFESGTTTGTGGGAGGTAQQNNISFPWQFARPREDVAPESHLIGKVRVVPVFRQNAVLVMGPPHYQTQITDIIDKLDKPGRQVLITAIIAEVQLETALSLGLRWSRNNVFGPGQDNQLGGSGNITGEQSNILEGLFETSVLNVDINLNAVLDLLKTESDVRILSEPRIFTADNEQANFFDGSDVQVVVDSQTTDQGTLNESFDFRPIGIIFSARPRITATRDIDLLVSLELSSLSPSATQNGGLIIDRRTTQTRVVIKNGQTIVISGILREQESDVKRKVPLLGDLPLIGALFTSTDTSRTRSELIAFIRPIVVDNPEENESLNQPMRDRLRDLREPLNEQRKKMDNPDRSAWDAAVESDAEGAQNIEYPENGPQNDGSGNSE